jgi:hypothetical protein
MPQVSGASHRQSRAPLSKPFSLGTSSKETGLTGAMATSHIARQKFDLAEPRPLVITQHRAHDLSLRGVP